MSLRSGHDTRLTTPDKREDSKQSPSKREEGELSLEELLNSLKTLSQNKHENDPIKFLRERYQSGDELMALKRYAVLAQEKPLTEWQTIPNDNLVDCMEIIVSAYFPTNVAVDYCRIIQELASAQVDNEKEMARKNLAHYTPALEKICPAPDNIIGVLIVSQILLAQFLNFSNLNASQFTSSVESSEADSILLKVATSYKNTAITLLKKARTFYTLEVSAITDQLRGLGKHGLAEEIMPLVTPRKKLVPKGKPPTNRSVSLSLSEISTETDEKAKMVDSSTTPEAPSPTLYQQGQHLENLWQEGEANDDLASPPLSTKTQPHFSTSPKDFRVNLKESKNETIITEIAQRSSAERMFKSNFADEKSRFFPTSSLPFSLFQSDKDLENRIKKLFDSKNYQPNDSSGQNHSDAIIQCLAAFENALNKIKSPTASIKSIREHFNDIYLTFKAPFLTINKGQSTKVEAAILTNAAYWNMINTPLTAIKTLLDFHLKEKQFNKLRAAFYTLIGALAGGLIAAGLGAVALTIGGVAAASGATVLITYSLFSRKKGLNKKIIETGQAFVNAVDTAMQATAPKNNG
jgi:hypothetical protein